MSRSAGNAEDAGTATCRRYRAAAAPLPPRRAGRPFNQPRPLFRALANHETRCAPSGQWRTLPLSNGPIGSAAAARIQRKPALAALALRRAVTWCWRARACARRSGSGRGGVAMASNAASLNAVRETMDGAWQPRTATGGRRGRGSAWPRRGPRTRPPLLGEGARAAAAQRCSVWLFLFYFVKQLNQPPPSECLWT